MVSGGPLSVFSLPFSCLFGSVDVWGAGQGPVEKKQRLAAKTRGILLSWLLSQLTRARKEAGLEGVVGWGWAVSPRTPGSDEGWGRVTEPSIGFHKQRGLRVLERTKNYEGSGISPLSVKVLYIVKKKNLWSSYSPIGYCWLNKCYGESIGAKYLKCYLIKKWRTHTSTMGRWRRKCSNPFRTVPCLWMWPKGHFTLAHQPLCSAL